MKKENLQRGMEIQKEIERYESELHKWESATTFHCVKLKTENGIQEVDQIYSFETIKILTVQSIKDALQILNDNLEKL